LLIISQHDVVVKKNLSKEVIFFKFISFGAEQCAFLRKKCRFPLGLCLSIYNIFIHAQKVTEKRKIEEAPHAFAWGAGENRIGQRRRTIPSVRPTSFAESSRRSWQVNRITCPMLPASFSLRM